MILVLEKDKHQYYSLDLWDITYVFDSCSPHQIIEFSEKDVLDLGYTIIDYMTDFNLEDKLKMKAYEK